jgi:hypothetical protein
VPALLAFWEHIQRRLRRLGKEIIKGNEGEDSMKKVLPFILIAGFLLAACGTSARSASVPSAPDAYNNDAITTSGGAPVVEQFAPSVAPMPATGIVDQSANGTVASNDSNGAAAHVDRLVIQNADLAIVVKDVEGRMNDIISMADAMGGHVVSSNLYQSYTNNNTQVPEATIVVRVPAEKLQDALKQIKADVVEVQSETLTGTDVTADYVDLQSRLKNLQVAESQLEDIMAKADKTEDVVNIFNQLVTYREQIELVKGQMKYYEESAALSAISVRIIAQETIQPIKIAGWEPKGVARDAAQDLVYFYQDFVSFLIRFVIYTLPVLITIGIPLYLIFLGLRAVFRKMRGNKKKEETQIVEEKK